MTNSIFSGKNIFVKMLILFAWLAVWQAFYSIIQNEILIPAPVDVLTRLGELLFIRSFWVSIFFTISRVFIGVFLAVAAGVVLGIASGLSKLFYDMLSPMVVAIKSTPIMSFIIVALVWFGSNNVPIFICFLIAFPIVWTNIQEGIQSVDKKLLEMATLYRVPKLKILMNVYLPEIYPFFISGFLTIIGLGWKATVTAEVLSHPMHALGSRLYDARIAINSIDLFALTLSIIGISLLIELIIIRFITNPQKGKFLSVS
ncbi:MAG TPA: ABC transporter permease subunit [Candidatus Limnocylindrales bacterium]|nr:ABC transporter permease subunit [Candidatus Limnocylindrales bacterium]